MRERPVAMEQVSVDQAMRSAVEHHLAGRVAEAERIYQQILGQYPDHSDAMHLLGILAAEAGRCDLAIELTQKAIAIQPAAATYRSNLGEFHRRWKQFDQAIAACRKSGGTGHLVDDETVWSIQSRLAREEGIFCEPAGAVSLAAAIQARAEGLIGADDPVCCMITGSGFKDAPSITRMLAGITCPLLERL